MKHKITLLLLLLIAVLLSACGQEATATVQVIPTATTAAATATTEAATANTEAATATTAATATSEPASTATTAAATATTEATASTAAATATSASGSTTQDATPAVVAAANAFLATLSDSEKSSVLFDWSDDAQKANWSNLPQGLYQRDGLMWGNLSDATRTAWLALMRATLSEEGYNRVLAEWNADDQLAGGGGNLQYGTQYYWIAIIGTPSATDPWMWQFGGHHVTINATVTGSTISLTPSFIGVQPASYTDANGNTVRPLGDIEDEAFALINSLDSTQQAAAILGSTYIDLVLGPGQDGKTIQSEGIKGSDLTADQQAALLKLIGHYVGLVNDEDAAVRMAEIQADIADTYFAWYGSTTKGQAAYFRITGPTIVVEYSPQQMGGNAANHIHGIYRDPTNEYGSKYTQ